MIASVEKALVVDDDVLMREFVVETLDRERVEVVQAGSGTQARKLMEERDFDVAFVDIKMPGLSGMELLRWMQEARIPTLTVMITAFGTVEQAVEAMQLGAMDFLMKPFSPEQVEVILNRARDWARLNAQNTYLKEELGWTLPRNKKLMGRSHALRTVMDQIERVAEATSTVLITGESGTGKELVAQAIHGLSPRRNQPYVRMNCAAVPESLADSELFGHEKGAFTGAIQRRLGRFELAGNGTLLLDEISEMPMSLQAKLLRVIQEREFERVGGARTLRAECRLIATTNRDLAALALEGGFRKDLFYRLNVVPIRVPPLRERPDDIPLLAQTFLERYARKTGGGRKPLDFHEETLAYLERYAWPGNVRELEHLVERLCVMEKGPRLTPASLPPEMCAEAKANAESAALTTAEPASAPQPCLASETESEEAVVSSETVRLDEIERHTILRVLERTGWHRNRAAELLGISIRTLRNKLSRYREEGSLPQALA